MSKHVCGALDTGPYWVLLFSQQLTSSYQFSLHSKTYLTMADLDLTDHKSAKRLP